MELINKYQVWILNYKNSPPTYLSILGQSLINFVLLKNTSNTDINKYDVHDEILLSDHNLNAFSLKIKREKKVKILKMTLQEANNWKSTMHTMELMKCSKSN